MLQGNPQVAAPSIITGWQLDTAAMTRTRSRSDMTVKQDQGDQTCSIEQDQEDRMWSMKQDQEHEHRE